MIRTRFAPSPTGSLHVGNARVAVLNWLFARRHGGHFLLRIEDTDAARTVSGSEAAICEDLRWLGLDWDEGPVCAGAAARGRYGPYRQSERLALYQERAAALHAAGRAYPCYCTAEEVAARRAAAIAAGRPAHYDRRCLGLSAAERTAFERAGRQPALRMHTGSSATIDVHDAARGVIHVAGDEIGDFVLLRADGEPTYNFAVVVDDIAMRISHVIRGVGHLSNTPRQILLYRAFDEPPPVFAHVPTVLGPDRQKLSKRHGAEALAGYRTRGYHPDAVLNYLSLLAWSSPTGDEVLTRERLIAEVSLERVRAADAVFDPAKLSWLSGRHIEAMPLADLVAATTPFIRSAGLDIDAAVLPTALAAVRTHLDTFDAAPRALAAFFPDQHTAPAAVALHEDPGAVAVLRVARTHLGDATWDEEGIAAALEHVKSATVARGRALYEPLRLALTGRAHGPPFAALLLTQGRARVLARIDAVIAAREPIVRAEASEGHPEPG